MAVREGLMRWALVLAALDLLANIIFLLLTILYGDDEIGIQYEFSRSVFDLELENLGRSTIIVTIALLHLLYGRGWVSIALAVSAASVVFPCIKAAAIDIYASSLPSELIVVVVCESFVAPLAELLVLVALLLSFGRNVHPQNAHNEAIPLLGKRDSNRQKPSFRGLIPENDGEDEWERGPVTLPHDDKRQSSLHKKKAASPASAPQSAPTTADPEALAMKREMIANEIHATETSYVRTLDMIVTLFLEPMRNASQSTGRSDISIDRAQVKSIFLEIETIRQLHVALLQDLDVRMKHWSSVQKIADVFFGYISFMKVYTRYANNFESAMQTLTTCRRDDGFSNYLKKCKEEREECGKLWLEDHLITPIQRVPRYILLFKELLKRTRSDHPDFADIQKLISEFERLAGAMNEGKSRAEKSMMMVQIQRMVKRCPEILIPTRTFLNDFPCFALPDIPMAPTATAPTASTDGSDRPITFVPTSAVATQPMVGTDSASSLAPPTPSSNRSSVYMEVDATPQVDPDTISIASSVAGSEYSAIGDVHREASLRSARDVHPENVTGTEVVLYVFNDIILVATHVSVRGVFNRTKETVKRLALQQDVIRPVTKDDAGEDTMRKFKFQRICNIAEIKIEDISLPGHEHSVAITYVDCRVLYDLPSAGEKKLLLQTVRNLLAEIQSETSA